jgi:hypothetical protein
MRNCGPLQRGPPQAPSQPARSIGQAARLDGITPAALTLLVAHLKRAGTAADRARARSQP